VQPRALVSVGRSSVRAFSSLAALGGIVALSPSPACAMEEIAAEVGWWGIVGIVPLWGWIIALLAASMAVLVAMAIAAVDSTDIFPEE
jgi:hypothetical protein